MIRMIPIPSPMKLKHKKIRFTSQDHTTNYPKNEKGHNLNQARLKSKKVKKVKKLTTKLESQRMLNQAKS